MNQHSELAPAAVSVGSVVTSFFLSAVPALQFFALIIAIISGLLSIKKYFDEKTK